jgi:hypothetical protein
MLVFALHDSNIELKKAGAIPVKSTKPARKLNLEGWGIFSAVNSFKGELRRNNEGSHILSFFAEIDGINKDAQKQLISKNLQPTRINESKNGYHVFWDLEEPYELNDSNREAMLEVYHHLLRNKIAPKMMADIKACDFSRILRLPNYYHMKNPQEPFLVKEVHHSGRLYTIEEIDACFPLCIKKQLENKKKIKYITETKNIKIEGNNFWEKIWNMNQKEALEKLSGTDALSFEKISFKRNYKGTYNILVDNKMTSSWIDTDGKIGSRDSGGPTVANWVNWYHRDWAKTAIYLKKYFPELEDKC